LVHDRDRAEALYAAGAVDRTAYLSGHAAPPYVKGSTADNTGAVSNVATVIVNVEPPPVANNDTASTSTNQGVTIAILGNDSVTGTTLDPTTITITSPPSHGSLAITPSSGVVTYDPSAGFVGTEQTPIRSGGRRGRHAILPT
jgi:hypothetical protein